MKKILASVLSVCLLVSLSFSAFAETRATAYGGTNWGYFFANSTTAKYKTINNDFGGSHMGIDLPVGEETTAYSVTSGTVELAFVKFNADGSTYPSSTVGYGLALNTGDADPNTGNDLIVTYQHFKSRPIKNGSTNIATGDSLSKGDTVGKTGNTGNSTGPHLHFDVSNTGNWWGDNSLNGHVDPKLFYNNVSWAYSRAASSYDAIDPSNVLDVAFIDYVGEASFEQWLHTTSMQRSIQSPDTFKAYFNITPEIEAQVLLH